MPLWGWIALIAIAVIALFLIFTYNALVRLRNMVDEAWNQISVQLKRRHDLIPNLVNAVKGYMDFEQETLTKVIEARSAAVNAHERGSRQRRAGCTGRELPDRRPAAAVRPRRELPRPQGERERHAAPGGADDDREPDRLQPAALQQHRARVQHLRSRRSRTSSSPACSASASATTSRSPNPMRPCPR